MKTKVYAADFETTTDINDCRVWAYGLCEVGNPTNFIYGNSIDEFMEICSSPKYNYTLYFHNLKFDGEFIISWLLNNGYKHIEDKKNRKAKTFTTLISDMGAFYSIEIYFDVKGKNVNKVKIYDSLKILNFSVSQIAKDFNLINENNKEVRKLDLDYKASREVGHELTVEEVDYLKADVEIMARALDIMFRNDLTKMTIGSDALSEYKKLNTKFKKYFPILPFEIDKDIRKAYKGGFTYLNDCYKEKESTKGFVLDVNSLYPSVMVNEELPYGTPLYFTGQYQEDKFYPLYIQCLTCCFELKENKIPTIQVKNNLSFMPNEYLKSSKGDLVTMTLTNVDLKLFFEHYNVTEITYNSGWKFKKSKGLFTQYIEKWTKEKIKAKKENNGAMYRIAKLMLNSLYGKFGLNPETRSKYPFLDENGIVRYRYSDIEIRDSIYIPVAAFITSYARNKTIRTSQAIKDYSLKHYGKDYYIYSDTDSIHLLDMDKEILASIVDIDEYRLGAWKVESEFVRGKYIRQKCYIELGPDGVLNTTIAGLPKRLGNIMDFDNFKVGFTTENMDIKGDKKLAYKHVKGGVVLVDTDFSIK